MRYIVCLINFALCVFADELAFNHHVQYDHDNGESLQLQSKGRFAETIDLDDYKGIKRLLCKSGLIMIALKDEYKTPKWKPGQILLGSSKWSCMLSHNTSKEGGIYTRIKQIIVPKDNRIDIVTENVGPFDILDEADIHLRYSTLLKNGHNPTRQKRKASNMLTDLLNNIDWNANATLQIPYNYNQSTGKEIAKFSLHRYSGLKNLVYWPMDGDEANDTGLQDSSFVWSCRSCYGHTKIDYTFNLVIWKVNNKPVIKRYISQIEADTTYNADYRMKFKEEKSFHGARLLWHSPPRELLRVQLAKIKTLPPVELVISSNDAVFAQIRATVSGSTTIDSHLTSSGKYVFSQKLMPKSTDHGDATTYDWGVKSHRFDVNATGKVNITASFIQTVLVNASVTWTGKDVSARLSPPAIITITPEVSIRSNVKEFSKCYSQDINVRGDFQFDRAKFLVQAFGLKIWNVFLSSGYHKKFSVLKNHIGSKCSANCAGSTETNKNITREITAGANILRYLYGNEMLFISPSGDAFNDTVCSNGTLRDKICTTRQMSADFALMLERMVQFVRAEWPNDKVVVLEAFVDRSTLKYGNHSLHYDGNAAKVSTKTLMVYSKTTSDTTSKLNRLGELAVCAGFSNVKVDNNDSSVHIDLIEEDTLHVVDSTLDHAEKVFRSAFNKVAMSISKTKTSCQKKFPQRLTLGQTFPPGKTEIMVCGPEVTDLHRVSFDTKKRLYFYAYDDVTFEPESTKEKWCGLKSRKCHDCKNTSSSYIWDWCSNRMMTHRLALRLHKLAVMSKQESINVHVVRGYLEQAEGMRNTDMALYSPLFKEGRAVRIGAKPEGTVDFGRLASLAICAGFDFVAYTNNTYIDVFVKPQEPFTGRITSYPKTGFMNAVPLNKLDGQEYMPHERHINESRIPILLDGHDAEKYLSDKYKIADVLSPGSRYFRFDQILLECIELASDDFGRKIDIVSGSAYRTRSLNLDNIDDRGTEEMYRYQSGQAVEVFINGSTRPRDLVNIGKSIVRSCPVVTRPLQLVIGIGCHKDRLYIDIRPATSKSELRFLKLWDSGGSSIYLGILPYIFAALTGGSIISPFDKTIACSSVSVDMDHRYLTFELNQPTQCSETHQRHFCSQSKKYREEEAHLLQERLSSAAGSNNLPRPDIMDEIRACVVGPCGGCTGSGAAWDVKVRSCARMIQKYISRASRPFQKLHNRAAFFNTENLESTVHSLACHLGSVCVENIQLYSLLMPLIMSRYKLESETSVEERLFNAEDNPTPLLELVSQEMAIRASGIVKVYIDAERDLSMLRNVLKVLMVYNKNVTKVEFHVTKNMDDDMVRFSVQRNVELWSGATCSDWSRFAVTPYTIHSISEHRQKRSARRSITRNFAKLNLHDWEFEWLSKM